MHRISPHGAREYPPEFVQAERFPTVQVLEVLFNGSPWVMVQNPVLDGEVQRREHCLTGSVGCSPLYILIGCKGLHPLCEILGGEFVQVGNPLLCEIREEEPFDNGNVRPYIA